MLVLIGFAGFGVDVTSAYAKSQEIQNGADAAALGTAQHCAQSAVPCSDGSEAARATGLARENVRLQSDTVLAKDTYPAGYPNWVTVEVTGEHQNYFAGALGFNSFTVVREATAAWGSPTQMTTLLPLTIGECEFNAFVASTEAVTVINLTKTSQEECGTPTSGNVLPGGFGYIGTGDCQDNLVDLNANDGWYPMDPGGEPPGCDHGQLQGMVDSRSPIVVPVFDECRMRPNPQPDDNRCSVADIGASPLNGYHIKGFAAIELHGIKFGGGGHGLTYPQSGPDNINTYCPGNDRCIRGRFVDWVDLSDAVEWGPAPDYGVQSVRLIDPDHEAATP
ncbi:pilus assembly protein TadG-related protein [Ornithinimicrobium sp. W1665]